MEDEKSEKEGNKHQIQRNLAEGTSPLNILFLIMSIIFIKGKRNPEVSYVNSLISAVMRSI